MMRILAPHPALLVGKTLVIADLHIGFEGELRTRGIKIPSQTRRIYIQAMSLVRRFRPSRLVLLGDVKHGVPTASHVEWSDVPDFLTKLSTAVRSVEVVPGNHDGDLLPLTPRTVKIHPAEGIAVGGVWLLHGHALPPKEASGFRHMVMGHIHPSVELADAFGFRVAQPVWLRCPLRTAHGRAILTVMPAFNRLMGKLPVNRQGSPDMGPIFRRAGASLDDAEAYALDGTLLGRVSALRLP